MSRASDTQGVEMYPLKNTHSAFCTDGITAILHSWSSAGTQGRGGKGECLENMHGLSKADINHPGAKELGYIVLRWKFPQQVVIEDSGNNEGNIISYPTPQFSISVHRKQHPPMRHNEGSPLTLCSYSSVH